MMKSLISSFCTLAFALMTVSTFAMAANPSVNIKNTGAKSFLLQLEELKSNEILISLEDQNGYKLYEQEVKNTDSFTKKFNLSDLPDGSYFLKIEDKMKIQVYPIEIENNELTIDERKQKKIFKPVFSTGKGYVNVHMFRSGKTNMTISLFDEQGEIVYEQSFILYRILNRRFDLSKLKKGKYTISVKANDQIFMETIAIK